MSNPLKITIQVDNIEAATAFLERLGIQGKPVTETQKESQKGSPMKIELPDLTILTITALLMKNIKREDRTEYGSHIDRAMRERDEKDMSTALRELAKASLTNIEEESQKKA